jgi:hypothetical protein
MLKKLYSLAILLLLSLGIGSGFVLDAALAADPTTPTTPPTSSSTPPLSTSQFLHTFNYSSGGSNDSTSKIGIVAGIAAGTVGTSGTWQMMLAGIIKFILSITGALAFVSFSYAGIMMVTAQGNEDHIKKGKNLLLWSILALAIIATSYALILGISQLQF